MFIILGVKSLVFSEDIIYNVSKSTVVDIKTNIGGKSWQV